MSFDESNEETIDDKLHDLYSYQLSDCDSEALYFLLHPYLCKRFKCNFTDSSKWYLKHFVSIILFEGISLNTALNYLIEALYYIARRDILYECNITYDEYQNLKFGKYLDPKRVLLYKFYDGSAPDEFKGSLKMFLTNNNMNIPRDFNEFEILEDIVDSRPKLMNFIIAMKGLGDDFRYLCDIYKSSGCFSQVNEESSLESVQNAVPEGDTSLIPKVAIEKGDVINQPCFGQINETFTKVNFENYNDTSNPSYPELSPHKSICIIFNNYEYEDNPRTNTEIDVKRIEDTFSRIHFDTRLFENLPKDEMIDIIKTFTNKEIFSDPGEMIVCVIMAHGYEDGFYDINRNKVPYANFYDLFRAKNCSTFREKPKIFIIQACRGDTHQTFTKLKGSSKNTRKIETNEQPVNSTSDGVTIKNNDNNKSDTKSKVEFKSYVKSKYVPDEADFMKVNATTHNNTAARSMKDGSPFIHGLCDSIDRNKSKMHFTEIFMEANNMICEKVYRRKYINCAELTTTARCKIYLQKPE